MAKIRIDPGLIERAKKVAEEAGYSSVEELVSHAVEEMLARHESADEEQLIERLRGLGYVD